MYRALAFDALRRGISLDDAEALSRLAEAADIRLAPAEEGTRVLLNGEDVTRAIRSAEMSQAASRVAQVPGVRGPLVALQRRAGRAGGVVMEGRDIGTEVFPDAGLKVYLDANVEVRAQRRLLELVARGETMSLEEMVREVVVRDQRDLERPASPLSRAADAVFIDCSAMEAEEVARLIAMLAREREEHLSDAAS
jgi:cytidylate kinase